VVNILLSTLACLVAKEGLEPFTIASIAIAEPISVLKIY